jgi:hypothetical protein
MNELKRETPPVGFFFDVETLDELSPGGYDRPALTALFAAVLACDDEGASFQVREGDLLLHNLAYTTAKVTFTGKGDATGYDGVAVRSEGDTKLFQTLIWDFCDALEDRWHSFDQASLPRALGRRDIFAIALSALPLKLREAVDSSLRGREFYLGGFEVDPGNPVQQRVTGGGLIHFSDYRERALLFDPWQSEEPLDPPPLDPHGDEWFGSLPFAAVRYMTEEEYGNAGLVPGWPTATLSTRGRKSADLIEARRDRGHLGRVAEGAQALRVERDTPPFELSVDAMRSAVDALIDDEKLVGYALNPEHSGGGADKARWFHAALGIDQADWSYLAAQLKLGLEKAPEIGNLRSTEYGLRYEVRTTVLGLNGVRAVVVSVWQVESGRPPKFITVFPGRRDEKADDISPLLVLPSSLKGDERWAALWEIAEGYAGEAADRTVPTPMRVEGVWYEDGEFGFANFGVADARRGFARWLRREKRAHLQSGRGAVIPAPFHMYDQAVAYANAFAEVLTMNGVETNVRCRLD